MRWVQFLIVEAFFNHITKIFLIFLSLQAKCKEYFLLQHMTGMNINKYAKSVQIHGRNIRKWPSFN